TSSPTSGATFTVDNTPPTVTISAPSVALTKSGPVTYTVTYADTFFNSSTLASGNITLNTTGTASATTIGITGTGTTRTVTLSGISGDGTIGISIAAGTASDTAGNLAPAAGPSATFTVDNSAPAAPSTPILAAGSDSGITGDNITNDTSPTFTGTAEAGSTVTIFVDGVSKGSGTATGGNYSITTTALTAATRSITATATDAVGNVSPSSGALSITIDTTGPTVTVNQAATQVDPTNVSPINFTVVFSETVTDFNCSSVTLGGTIAGANKSCGTITGAGLTYNVPVNITGTVSGTVQLSISGNKVHDVAGNGNTASTSTDNTITFDNVPPSAPSTPDMTAATDSGISNTDNITNVTTPVFTGTAATGTAVSIFSDGLLVGTGTAANYNSPGITVSALLDGAHSITARATDAVGNVSVPSGALSITIDTIAPTPPPSAPALLPSTVGNPEDGVTTSTTPSFYGTSTDATAGFVAIYSDGVQVGSGSVSNYQNSGLGVSVTAPLALGPHTITAKAMDTAGNVSGSSAPSSITLISTIKETDIGTASTGNVTASTLNETGVDVAAGNTVFVTVAMDPDTQTVTVSDTASGGTNTYTKDADVTTGSGTSGIRTLIFSAFVNHALSAGTITISSVTPANMVATFFYFNGIVSSSPKDLCHTGAGIGITKNTTVLTSEITATAATCTGSTPAATSQADELLIGGLGLNDQGGSLTPGDSFTNLAKSQNGGGASHTFQVQPSYLVVKNTGQYAAAWTYNMDSSKHWATAIVTYKIVTPTIVSIVMDSASITTLPATTNLNNVNFTVTFSEPVFGVDAEDFALVSTGVSGSSITGVTTSDNTVYSVAVSTGTGNGTIQLNYHDDADLTVDANNIPLNGSAAGAVTVPGPLYTVSKSIATTTAVSSSNASPTYGSSITFTAKVHAASGSTAPTGSVTFTIDGTPGAPIALGVCSPPSATDACASVSTSSLAVNGGTAHTVVANYTPSVIFTTSDGGLSPALAVSAAPLTATVTADAKQYDGTTTATLHCSLATGIFSVDVVTCSATGAFASKDVATPQTVNITNITLGGAQADNYSLTTTTGTTSANITPATLTINVSAAGTTYTGLPYAGATTCSADGVNSEHPTATPSYQDASHGALGSAPTNAGSYFVLCSAGGVGTNYIVNSNSAAFTINKADPVVTAVGGTFGYDGNPHAGSGSAKGVQDEDLTPSVNVAYSTAPAPGNLLTSAPVNAGSYLVAARFAGNNNYNPKQSAAVPLIINQADAVINVSGFTGKYDGNAHGASGTATGVKGEDLSSLFNLGSTFTSVPGGTAHWTFNAT
ncbi:MAG: hypothetical protein DMG44_20350, partial [Acidobacteria bacterium]